MYYYYTIVIKLNTKDSIINIYIYRFAADLINSKFKLLLNIIYEIKKHSTLLNCNGMYANDIMLHS